MFKKADIEKARNRYWLKEAQKQVGTHITSLNQVRQVKPKKKYVSLGKRLEKVAKRY